MTTGPASGPGAFAADVRVGMTAAFLVIAGLPTMAGVAQAPDLGTRVVCAAAVLLFLGLAALVVRRRHVPDALAVGIIVVGDAALFFGALSAPESQPTYNGLSLCLYGIPTMFAALFMKRTGLLLQVGAVAVLTVLLFELRNLQPGAVAPAIAVVIGVGGPAFVVRVLIARLDRAVRDVRALSVTDPLTGLANRRGMEEGWPELVREARRSGLAVGALVIDVDHFKQVNDQHGHAAGDAVLRGLSRRLTELTRGSDAVVRLGGEELAVLSVLRPDELAGLGERIRAGVEHDGELRPTVTVSIGVAWHYPDAGSDEGPETLWALLDEADALLYTAKQSGRNRVVALAAA